MENLFQIRGKELALCFIIMGKYIKENGLMILDMERDMKNFKMDVIIKGGINMAKCRGLECIHGLMGRFMRENGRIIKSMELVCGKMKKEIIIQDNGTKAKQMEQEYSLNLQAIDMREVS